PAATEEQCVQAAVEAVARAVELGVRYFDTSPAYGPDGAAERYLGRGLQHLPLATRSGLTVSTKVGTHPERRQQYDGDAVRWSFERSRELLGRIDVVYVHDPGSDAHLDQILGPGGAFEALEQLRAQGEIRALGLGVRNHRFLRRVIDSGRCDAILPSYDYHPLRTSAGPLIEWAAARGVGVANASPYNAGLLAGIDLDEAARRRPPHDVDLARARQLAAWCRQRRVDLGALAVQHSLRNPHIHTVLVGPRTAAEVASCVRHAETALAEEQWQEFSVFAADLQPPPAPGGEAQ
ncbi:MAG: aldo/keto reductase, partial [Gemmatimonadota bacterium]